MSVSLSAPPRDSFSLQPTASVPAGLIAGIALSLAVSKFLAICINEPSRDPRNLTLVTANLIAAATGASLLPARRAASTDSITVLRHD